jgi:hypothetical protein
LSEIQLERAESSSNDDDDDDGDGEKKSNYYVKVDEREKNLHTRAMCRASDWTLIDQ